ncbi:MAG: aminotransferase class I/II-fold pyridoxal phosphate-dependent enzyme [Bacteroidota bacterium]
MEQQKNPDLPQSLSDKLAQRKLAGNYRKLTQHNNLIDFASNDYLGFANHPEIKIKAKDLLQQYNIKTNGSKGSRLISGNYPLIEDTEEFLAKHYKAEAALLFNSGYLANLGLISAISHRNSIIIYDELVHASIRDGILLGFGKSFKFKHNDLTSLEQTLQHNSEKFPDTDIFVVTEAIFSMDGDGPNLSKLISIAQQYNAFVVVDEAHSIGIFELENLLGNHQLNDVFARVVTFGKAMGVHGACVLGSNQLREFLINFARSFIYTTALPPTEVANIQAAHQLFEEAQKPKTYVKENIRQFRSLCAQLRLEEYFIESFSAIQSCVFTGNQSVQKAENYFLDKAFHIKAIKHPTVQKQQERLRFSIHSYNNPSEIEAVLKNLALFIYS